MVSMMNGLYDATVTAIAGGRPEDGTQVTILNRVFRWGPGQIVVEADPSHSKRIVGPPGGLRGSGGAGGAKFRSEVPRHVAPEGFEHRPDEAHREILGGVPRFTWRFRASAKGSSIPVWIEAYSVSDWAACRGSWRSTSGGLLLVGGAVMKSLSSAQAAIATSSGEAKYHASAKAAAVGLRLQAVALDPG